MTRTWRALALALPLCAATGCQTAGYYAQAVRGHCLIVARQQPVADVLKDPQAAESLKEKLRLVLDLRAFAANELLLPVRNHYSRYADLGRNFVVWNVTATPEFSMEAKSWWYPFVGRLEYRGYFEESKARRLAADLSREGFDVDVGGVTAYSTLGWFRDPVLNTFIHDPEVELAELLFHELAHQRLFVSGDTDFSEAFAEAVAEEGTRRWLRTKGAPSALAEYEARLRRKADFTRLVTGTHDKLAALYRLAGTGAPQGAEARSPEAVSAVALRARKQAVLDEMRRDYERLKSGWAGAADYDRWFQRPLNNARLNDVDTYYRLVPAFHALLRECGGDMGKFFEEVHSRAKLPKAERHRTLEPRSLGAP